MRIDISDTTLEAIQKLSDGNGGAVMILAELVKVDKFQIIMLDNYGIYGADIYILYSDKCGRDIDVFLSLLGIVKDKKLPIERLKALAKDRKMEFNLTEYELKTMRKWRAMKESNLLPED